jgi:hypothetical protein
MEFCLKALSSSRAFNRRFDNWCHLEKFGNPIIGEGFWWNGNWCSLNTLSFQQGWIIFRKEWAIIQFLYVAVYDITENANLSLVVGLIQTENMQLRWPYQWKRADVTWDIILIERVPNCWDYLFGTPDIKNKKILFHKIKKKKIM